VRPWRVLALACALAPAGISADEPPKGSAPQASSPDPCLILDNRILGPRSGDRPLPLLSGDAAHGFHPVCAVPWSKLSPHNQPLAVVECVFHGSLLQVANDSACGPRTGPLWVSGRWVMTSAELQRPAARAATCQQLDTGAWAGTRAYSFDCLPQKQELKTLKPAPAASERPHD
jgi:hypothetical protein